LWNTIFVLDKQGPYCGKASRWLCSRHAFLCFWHHSVCLVIIIFSCSRLYSLELLSFLLNMWAVYVSCPCFPAILGWYRLWKDVMFFTIGSIEVSSVCCRIEVRILVGVKNKKAGNTFLIEVTVLIYTGSEPSPMHIWNFLENVLTLESEYIQPFAGKNLNGR